MAKHAHIQSAAESRPFAAVKAILFDFDETLVPTFARGILSWQKAGVEVGLPEVPIELLRARYPGGGSQAEIVARLFGGISEEKIAEVLSLHRARVAREVWPAVPGAADACASLRASTCSASSPAGRTPAMRWPASPWRETEGRSIRCSTTASIPVASTSRALS